MDDPMIDLMALAEIQQETEVTYIRRERDWASKAAADGRTFDNARFLPVLPPTFNGVPAPSRSNGNGNGHGHDHGDGHDHGVAAIGSGRHG